MPVYATITLIIFMSSMGLPLLNGFVGEFTILQGTFMENKVWAAWAVPGVILGAAYLLWLYQRVFFGPANNPKNEKLHDLSGRELATFVPLVAAHPAAPPEAPSQIPPPPGDASKAGLANEKQAPVRTEKASLVTAAAG